MHLEMWQWLLLALGALFIGLGKGGLPGIGNITVALYALVYPSAKESVGVLLPVLIAADIFAVAVYRRHTEWGYLWRLLPWTVVGVIIGALTMDYLPDEGVKRVIGATLVSFTFLHLWRAWLRKRKGVDSPDLLPHTMIFVAVTGIIGGFATMIANAAGPVAALYFLAVGLPKLGFIGTAAWFFFIINVFKVPFHVGLGNINMQTISVSAGLAVFSITGALTAPFLVKKINQKLFEALIWFFIFVAGINLLI